MSPFAPCCTLTRYVVKERAPDGWDEGLEALLEDGARGAHVDTSSSSSGEEMGLDVLNAALYVSRGRQKPRVATIRPDNRVPRPQICGLGLRRQQQRHVVSDGHGGEP